MSKSWVLFFLVISLPPLWLATTYQFAPVLDLKNKYEYTPIDSKKSRVAGLKSPQHVPFGSIPEHVRDIIVMTEDGNFYHHKGFDFFEIQQAIEEYKKEGKRLRGASTISQQPMKNIFFSSERSFLRKAEEAIYTIKLERNFSKAEILSLYLSNIQWGKEIYGIREASQYYLKKPVSQISVLDGAFLAVIIPNPVKYNRSFFKNQFSKFIQSRIRNVLELLEVRRKIESAAPLIQELNQYFGSHEEEMKTLQESPNYEMDLSSEEEYKDEAEAEQEVPSNLEEVPEI